MKRPRLILVAASALVAGERLRRIGGSSTSSSASGHVNIVMWQGYTRPRPTAIKKLAAEFNATHPNITVTPQFYGNSDYALQKVLAAIAGGKPPDISYLYGSWARNIATNPGVVTLNKLIAAGPESFGWNDFWPVERQVGDGRTARSIGVPALVDNLALVYNKKLFAQAGLSPPTANWTWTDFENAAMKLTDPAKKQFGWAYVNDAQRGHGLALLGDAVAGRRLDPHARRQAGGVRLARRRQGADAAADAGPAQRDLPRQRQRQLPARCSPPGHIGMLWTGPWDLPPNHRRQVSPTACRSCPRDQNHQTISGPDNWVVFNNGSARVTGGLGVPEVAHLAGDRSEVGADDR